MEDVQCNASSACVGREAVDANGGFYMMIEGAVCGQYMDKKANMQILTVNVLLDALVRQHAGTVAVDLITDANVVSEDSHVLEAGPAADGRVPANNRALDPGVLLDL